MQINFDAKQYIGKREEQQDNFVSVILDADNGFQLHVLADGMGGHNAGSVASEVVCQSFVQYFEHHQLQSPEQDLRAALLYANDAIAKLLKQKPELSGMGTTVIAMIYNEKSNQYSYVSVGDSPLYVFNQQGLKRINANHAYYEKLLNMVKAGVISQQQADNDPQRHAITSAVMGDKIPEIDSKTGLLKENEIVIMASDGIQTLSDSTHGEISQIAHQYGHHHETLTSQLLRAVQERNYEHQDNTSIIVIKSSIYVSQNDAPPKTQNQSSPTTYAETPNQADGTSSILVRVSVFFGLMLLVVALGFFVLKAQHNHAANKGDGSDKNTLYIKLFGGLIASKQPVNNANQQTENKKLDTNVHHASDNASNALLHTIDTKQSDDVNISSNNEKEFVKTDSPDDEPIINQKDEKTDKTKDTLVVEPIPRQGVDCTKDKLSDCIKDKDKDAPKTDMPPIRDGNKTTSNDKEV